MALWHEISGYRHILSPLEQTNNTTRLQAEDAEYWWSSLGPSLATLLEKNSYSQEQQTYYLSWFQQWIAPALGPRPRYGKPFYTSGLTHDKSCFEFSQNWKEKSDKQLVRFTLEPSGRDSGSANDLFNQEQARGILARMAVDVSSIDLERFDHFQAHTAVPQDATADIASKLLPGQARACILLAFDLDRTGIPGAKAYFVPQVRAVHDGVTQHQVVFKSIRDWKSPAGSYAPSVTALETYLQALPAEQKPEPFLVAIDCDKDPKSRIKVYLNNTSVQTLSKAKDMFSLGGKLNSANMKNCLAALDTWWRHIFAVDGPDVETQNVFPEGLSCVYAFEMRPSADENDEHPEIDVKMHIPLWVQGKTDAELSQRLAAWFKQHNHQEFADQYLSNLEQAFPKNSLDSNAGTHTWVSITSSAKTGLYMSMYYTPRLPEMNGQWS